jgi:hypothetical protein
MALFGAPIAHEDHAVRACYAALAMQATVTRYGDELQRSQGVPVQIRVGLHSGAVVVRGINSSLHMDYTAVGQTTHLAARMEQMAKPGSVLITVEALRLAEGFIQVETLGPVMVKGLADPVEVFELIGASSTRTRLQAFAARGLTRFVGRQPELVALRQALERAGTSHGQVVAVIGEPGVGKTRLIYEFIQSHYTHNWLVLESSSVSYGVSDCVEMHQNGQDENVAFFWHQICCGTHLRDSESLATARDSKKTDSKAICSLWMPRRKSPIFKLPVLIQFRVAADTHTTEVPLATAIPLPVRPLFPSACGELRDSSTRAAVVMAVAAVCLGHGRGERSLVLPACGSARLPPALALGGRARCTPPRLHLALLVEQVRERRGLDPHSGMETGRC